ncbi:MAG TPA: hypothetical protein VFB62_17000 [Polyangiaceae bacterium]|nr:hypothetical protein [Polyangiaceae bacterium]
MGGNIDEARCVAVMNQYQIGDYSVLLLAMPQPLFPTEAHHVALARDSAGTLRYFVMERAATSPMEPPRAFASEWCAGGARMRYGDLPAITSQAFLALITQELAPGSEPTHLSLPPPPPHTPSFHPTYRTTRPAPLSSKAGKWLAIGIGAFVSVLVGGWFAWRRAEMAHYLEEQQKREASVREADEAFAAIKKRAETRKAELTGAVARCRDAEADRTRATLERGRTRKTISTRRKTPKNKELLAGALAYVPPPPDSNLVIPATEAVPTTRWIARAKSNCAPLPKEVAELEHELARPVHRYAESYIDELGAKGRKLEDLLKALERVKIEVPPAKSIAVVNEDCQAGVVASFTSTVSGRRLDLETYNCEVTVTWLSIPDAEVLAAMHGRASALPKRDPGETTTDVALETLNQETHHAARDAAVKAVQKQLSTAGG